MAPAPTSEPIVQERQSMPHGYVFVPKGNVFITGHCRRRTQAANHTVYTVVDASSRKKTLGIRVPQTIYTSVRQSEAATRQDRANAVKKRDGALETQFCEEVLRLFPNIPSEAVPKVVQTAMRKGSGRVGRTGALGLEKRAILGVRAHIRHCETAYDGLLKNGMTRERAREKVIGRVDEVAGQWVGKQKKEGAEVKKQGAKEKEQFRMKKGQTATESKKVSLTKTKAKQGVGSLPTKKDTKAPNAEVNRRRSSSRIMKKQKKAATSRTMGKYAAAIDIITSSFQHDMDDTDGDEGSDDSDDSDENAWLVSDGEVDEDDMDWSPS